MRRSGGAQNTDRPRQPVVAAFFGASGGRLFLSSERLADGRRRPYTIYVSNLRTNQPQPFETRNGPSFRAIYDLSDLDNSRFVIPTGQSGNPLSPYYDQLTDLWAAGRYIRMATKIDEVGANAQARLVLKPAAGR